MSKRSSQSPRAKAHSFATFPSSKSKSITSSKLLHGDESFFSSNLAHAYLSTNNKNNNVSPNNQNEHLMLMSDLDLDDFVTSRSPIRPVSHSVTASSIAEGNYVKVPGARDSNYVTLQLQLAKAMDEMSHLRYSWNSEMESRSLLEQKNHELTHELELTRQNCTQMKSELENVQTLSSRLLLKHDNQEEKLQQAQVKASTLEKQLADSERTVAQLKSINEQYANSHSEKAKQLWSEKEKMLLDNINDLKDKNSLARKEISRLQEDNENISYQLEAKKKRTMFLEEEQAKLTIQQSETLLLLASLEKSIKENNNHNKNTDTSEARNPYRSPHSPGKDAEGLAAASLERDKKFLEDRLTLLETQLLEQQKQQFQQQQLQQQQLQQQFQLQWQSLQQQQQHHQEVLLAAVSRPVSAPSDPRHPVSRLMTEGISPLATNNPNADHDPVAAQSNITVPSAGDTEFPANITRVNINTTANFLDVGDNYFNNGNVNGRNVVQHPHRTHSFNDANPLETPNNGPRQQFQIPPLNTYSDANNIFTGSSSYSPNNNNGRYNNINANNNIRFPDNTYSVDDDNRPALRSTPPNNWLNSPNNRNMDTNGQQVRSQSSPSRANCYNNTFNYIANNGPSSPVHKNLIHSPINRPNNNIMSISTSHPLSSNPTSSFNINNHADFDFSLENMRNLCSPSMFNKYNAPVNRRATQGTEKKQFALEPDLHANNIVHDIYPSAEVEHKYLFQNTSAVLPPADADVDEGVPNKCHPGGNLGNNVPYDITLADENNQYYINDYNNGCEDGENGYYENNSTNRRNLNHNNNLIPANTRTNKVQSNNRNNNMINNVNKINNNNNRNSMGMNGPNNGPVQQRPQQNNYINTNNHINSGTCSNANYSNNNSYDVNSAKMGATNSTNNNRNNNVNANNKSKAIYSNIRNNIGNTNDNFGSTNSQKSIRMNNTIDNSIDGISNNNITSTNIGQTRSRGTTAEDTDVPPLSPSNKPTRNNTATSSHINKNSSTTTVNRPNNHYNTANYPTNSTSANNYPNNSINSFANSTTIANYSDTNNASAADNAGFHIVRREYTRAHANTNTNTPANVNTAAANNDGKAVESTAASSNSSRPLTQTSLRRLSSRYMQLGETTENSINRLLQEKVALKKQIMDFMKHFVKEHNRQPTKDEREAGAGKLAKEYRTISKVIEEIEKGTITSDMNPN